MPEAPVLPARHVFVYGTLRRGEDNDITRLTPAPMYVGEARVKGRLFDLGSYPGMLLGGDLDVVGEVYAITPALELVLDEIEMLLPQPTGEYAKRDILVGVAGATVPCIVYEINPAYALGKPHMASGNWISGRK